MALPRKAQHVGYSNLAINGLEPYAKAIYSIKENFKTMSISLLPKHSLKHAINISQSRSHIKCSLNLFSIQQLGNIRVICN